MCTCDLLEEVLEVRDLLRSAKIDKGAMNRRPITARQRAKEKLNLITTRFQVEQLPDFEPDAKMAMIGDIRL